LRRRCTGNFAQARGFEFETGCHTGDGCNRRSNSDASPGMQLACRGLVSREGARSMRLCRLKMLAIAVLPLCEPAIAAPYCVQTEAIPPQCLYYDATSCNARAKQMAGYCTVNTAELQMPAGIGHFCLLTSGNVSVCLYPDADSCNAEARRQNGVCVAAPARDESPAPDPYRHIRPLTVGSGARN
jgi:hypothetical protein